MWWEYAQSDNISFQMPDLQRSSENGNIEKVTVNYNIPHGYDWKSELPSTGAYCEGFGYYQGYQVTESPGYDIIRLGFTTEPTTNSPSRDNRKSGDTVWQIHLYTYERPLELHENASGVKDYKIWWNHSLAVSAEVTDAEVTALKSTGIISGFNAKTATDLTISKALLKKLRWVTDASGLPDGWTIGLTRKYTFDSYKDWAGTVTGTAYFKDMDAAFEAIASPPAVLMKPVINVPQCVMDVNKWMLEDVNAGSDGDLATLTATFSYYQQGFYSEIYPK